MPLPYTIAEIEAAAKKIETQPNVTVQDECVATALAAFKDQLTPIAVGDSADNEVPPIRPLLPS